MTGTVSSLLEPIIQLTVSGPTGAEADVDALIDTGFDGWLTLPATSIAALGLRWLRSGRMLLADGTEALFDVYEAIIPWDGYPRSIRIDEVSGVPLVGTAFLAGTQLQVEFRVGGAVTIQAIP